MAEIAQDGYPWASHPLSLTTGNQSYRDGMKITVKTSDIKLVSFTKHASDLCTHAYLLDSSRSVIASTTFVSNVATFSTKPTLSASTTYYLCSDGDGTAVARRRTNDGTDPMAGVYPISDQHITWVGCSDGNIDSTDIAKTVQGLLIDDLASTDETITPSALAISMSQPGQDVLILLDPLTLSSSLSLPTPTLEGDINLYVNPNIREVTSPAGSAGTATLQTAYLYPDRDNLLLNADESKVLDREKQGGVRT